MQYSFKPRICFHFHGIPVIDYQPEARTEKELSKSSCFSSFLYLGIVKKSVNQYFAGTYDGKSDSADHTIHHNVLPPKFSITSTKRSLITLFTDVHIYSREYFDLKPSGVYIALFHGNIY